MNKRVIKYIFTAAVIGLFAFNISKDHEPAVKKGLAFKLDQLNSGHLYLYLFDVSMAAIPEPQDNKDMRRLAEYYAVLAQYLPENSDARGLSGFTYFHTNQIKESYKAYKRAAELDPEFFWYHYNQAILLAKAGQANHAVLACREAVASDPKYAMNKILASRQVYFPLVLAKITEHIRSCKGPQCASPRDKMMEIFAQIKDQISLGYINCEEVLNLRDNPENIKLKAENWPLGGF